MAVERGRRRGLGLSPSCHCAFRLSLDAKGGNLTPHIVWDRPACPRAAETPCVNVSGIWRVAESGNAALMSAVSPVRSLLATRPPEDLRHDRAAPARHRALPPSRCSRGWMAVCPATPQIGPAGRPGSAPRQPIVAVDYANRRPDSIGKPRRLCRHICGSCLAPRLVGRRSLGRGRSAIAAGWWSWHPSLVSRDASRVQ